MQRVLSAILALDIVDFSLHMGHDDEATLSGLKRLFDSVVEIVGRHDGRVFGEAGDGLLVAFASPVQALRSALEIRAHVNALPDTSEQLHIRQALSLGDVIVDGDQLYGEAVNIAARLQSLAEPGGIVACGAFHEQVRRHVAADFHSLGRRRLKNIDMPIEVLQLTTGPPATGRRRRLGMALAAALALVLVAALAAYRMQADTGAESQVAHLATLAPLRERGPAIAVTPFEGLGDDARFRVLGDGIVEDITTDLSKIQQLQVVARNTTRTVAREGIGPRAIASSLGTSHVLEGTIRAVGDKFRINARLVDGSDGRTVWGERYDVSPHDIFSVEKDIVDSVVTAMALSLSSDERRRIARRDTTNLVAYENFRSGIQLLEEKTPEALAEALVHLQAAIAIDPTYAAANAAIGQVYWWSWVYGWEDSVGETWETAPGRAEEYLQRALLEPNAVAYRLAADMNLYARRFDEALGFAQLAVEHDPNDVAGHIIRAETLIYAGRPTEGRPWVELAMRLDPLFPPYVDFVLGMSYFGEDAFAEAATHFRRALERNPEDFGPAAPLAAALVHLGQHEAAKLAFDTYVAGWPEANLDDLVDYWPFQRLEDEERLTGPLIELGMPQSPPA